MCCDVVVLMKKCYSDPEGRHKLPPDWPGQLGAEGEDDLADPE